MLSNLLIFFSWTLWLLELKAILCEQHMAQIGENSELKHLGGATVGGMGRIFLVYGRVILGFFLLALGAHLTEGMVENQDFLF